MKIKQISGKTMRLVVMPSAKALIGQYEVFLETKMTNAAGKKLVFRYKDDDTVCVLFNAWCKGNPEDGCGQQIMFKEIIQRRIFMC